MNIQDKAYVELHPILQDLLQNLELNEVDSGLIIMAWRVQEYTWYEDMPTRVYVDHTIL